MAINLFAVIALRSTDPAGTDAALYVSTDGGHRNDGATNQYFREHLRVAPITVALDSARRPIQAPGRVSMTIDNRAGTYDAYLAGGSDPQYWQGSSVVLYYGGTDGGLISAMTRRMEGRIAAGTITIDDGLISFSVLDKRVYHDVAIVGPTFDNHPSYDSGTAIDGVGGIVMPEIIGDWTQTTDRLPGYKIAETTGRSTYAFCNHLLGSVTVYRQPADDTEAEQTLTLTTHYTLDLTQGEVILKDGSLPAPAYNDGDKYYIRCQGYPSTPTGALDVNDGNPVLIIQWLLTNYASVDGSTEIYNQITDASNGERGSFRQTYADYGSSSPDVKARAYIDDPTDTVLQVAARIGFETNLVIGNQVIGSTLRQRYTIYWNTLDAALVSPTSFREDEVELLTVSSAIDPDAQFATRGIIRYDADPSDDKKPKASYDTTVLTSGPIYDASTAWTNSGELSDIVIDETFEHVYDSSDIAVAAQRMLLWLIQTPEVFEATLLGTDISLRAFSVGIGDDITIDVERASGKTIRVLSVVEDIENGKVQITGVSLDNTLTAGVWLDASGLDAAGRDVASIWANASGEDGSGNEVNSVWI